MRARTWESVLPLQSSSSVILASISREGDSPLVVALFCILFAALAGRRGAVAAKDCAALVAKIIRHRAGRREVLVYLPGLIRGRAGRRAIRKRNYRRGGRGGTRSDMN